MWAADHEVTTGHHAVEWHVTPQLSDRPASMSFLLVHGRITSTLWLHQTTGSRNVERGKPQKLCPFVRNGCRLGITILTRVKVVFELPGQAMEITTGDQDAP
jgi:hypothetical protein